ncbi:MAG: ATP-binding protein [Chitinophagales bacterium]
MSKQIVFRQIIADFIHRALPKTMSREVVLPVNVSKIVSVIGARRVGKTFILFDLIRQLREEMPADRLVYVNFEDDRLFQLQLTDLDDLLRAYYELYPLNKQNLVYFFFDEIQEVPHWEKFVRRLLDTENCRIYVTGSSSKLLSRELATGLRGRTLSFEVFPLSFHEFLTFQDLHFNTDTSEGQALAKYQLRKYIRQGGFPELLTLPEYLHQRTINEYIDLMLYRDLVERFGIKNPSLLKHLMKYLFTNIANLLSTHKIYNDLKSQGFAVGKNTVYDYMTYLEEAFAVFSVQKWSRSVRKQMMNPNKIYALDPSYKYDMSISEDIGRVFENMVFLALKRKHSEIHYFTEKQEVDFVLPDNSLINAAYDLPLLTKQRELNSLVEGMNYFEKENALLITWDGFEDVKIENKMIQIRPLWWFFEPQNV